MHQYKTEAIILDTTEVFDADRSYFLISRELGNIRARAKGVRKPTSKLTGHLLSYLPTQLELVETGGWYLIVQAQLLQVVDEDGGYPQNTLDFLKSANLITEALRNLLIEHDPHPFIYELTKDILEVIRQEKECKSLQLAEYFMKCLNELGYKPELETCVITGQKILPEFIGWSSVLGGLLDEEGYKNYQEDKQIIKNPQTIILLRQFLKDEWVSPKIKVATQVEQEALNIIYSYLQTIIGKPLKTL